MDTSPIPSDDPLPEMPPAISELSPSELRLERERCALELERLSLEKDRLETERLRLQRERDLYNSGSNALHVGMGVLALAIAVFLALGLLFGYSSGLESGRLQAPPPRKILVSGPFLDLLRQTSPGTSSFVPPDPLSQPSTLRIPWVSLYARPAYSAAFGNLPLVR